MKRPRPKSDYEPRMSSDDRVIIDAMRDYPLRKGQMLLVTPAAIKHLTGQAIYEGAELRSIIAVYDRKDWNKPAC